MNLWRLFAVTRKEGLHIRRDPQTVVLVLVMPLVTLLLLGYTILSDITDIPMAISDLSHSTASRDLIAAFGTNDLFDIRYSMGGEDEMTRLMDGGEIRIGMIVPPDYAETLASGGQAQIAIFLDGSNPIVALTALNAVQTIAQTKSLDVVKSFLGSSFRGLSAGLDVLPRVWYNPELNRANFLIPALVGLVIQTFMTQLVAGAIVRERAQGTLEQLISTPLHSMELIVGKVIPYIGLALVTALEVLVVGLLWFDVEVKGSFSLLVLYSLIFLAATLAWAMLISAIARTDREARSLNMLLMLPSMMLSGMFFPITSLPPVLQLVSNLIPLTHFLAMIRAVVLKGVGIDMVRPQIVGLVAFTIVATLAAAARFKTKMA